jgi:hypothetical protein
MCHDMLKKQGAEIARAGTAQKSERQPSSCSDLVKAIEI